MATEIKHTCKTKLNANESAGTQTELTIVFDDDDATRKFAVRGIVIAAQSMWRDAGVIPSTDRVTVSELIKRTGGGFKATPDSIHARMLKMSDEDFLATLEKMGIDPRAAKSIMEAQRKVPTPAPMMKPAVKKSK